MMLHFKESLLAFGQSTLLPRDRRYSFFRYTWHHHILCFCSHLKSSLWLHWSSLSIHNGTLKLCWTINKTTVPKTTAFLFSSLILYLWHSDQYNYNNQGLRQRPEGIFTSQYKEYRERQRGWGRGAVKSLQIAAFSCVSLWGYWIHKHPSSRKTSHRMTEDCLKECKTWCYGRWWPFWNPTVCVDEADIKYRKAFSGRSSDGLSAFIFSRLIGSIWSKQS